MNPSEQFESFDDAEYPDLAEREYVLALEAECIEEESVGEYIDAVRDFYESGPRFGPSMSRMRYIAELVAQHQGETEATEGEVMSTACVEAFYSGEVLAFDVAKQWKDEYFPEAAVDIFDEAISEMMERHSAYGLPEDERLQVTRDETKAQLVTDGGPHRVAGGDPEQDEHQREQHPHHGDDQQHAGEDVAGQGPGR